MVALHIADKSVLTWFLDADSPAIGIAEQINATINWSFIFFGVMMVLFGTVRANGAVIAPLIIIASSMIGVRIGFVIINSETGTAQDASLACENASAAGKPSWVAVN